MEESSMSIVSSLIKEKETARPSSISTCFLLYTPSIISGVQNYSSKNDAFVYIKDLENLIRQQSDTQKTYYVKISLNSTTSKFKKRLDHLSKLKEGWDNEHASCIFPEVIKNIEKALNEDNDNRLWDEWVAFPDINGTITLMKKTGKVSISVGKDEYSYYGVKDGSEVRGDHKAFNTDNFLETLKYFSKNDYL